MENKIKKTHTNLTIFFWVNIISFAVLFLALLLYKGPDLGVGIQSNVLVEQCLIIVTLGAIPLALKMFHRQQKKMQNMPQPRALSQFKTHYFVRIAILDVVIILNLIGLSIFESRNFIFMALITIFALMLCTPSKIYLQTITKKIDDQTNE